MEKFTIDANIPISFLDIHIKLWTDFIKYIQESGHEVIIPQEIIDEVNGIANKRIVEECPSVTVVNVDDTLFRSIKTECGDIRHKLPIIQDNDYRLIASAIQYDANLISNDYALITVAQKYKEIKSIPKEKNILLTTANLLIKMHFERKDLFDWKTHVGINLTFYRHVEISNTYDGIKRRNWTEDLAKKRFDSYHQNISNTINGVKVS